MPPGRFAADAGRQVRRRSRAAMALNDRAFFVYGFSKADRASIRRDELHAFRALARELLGLEDRDLSVAAGRGAIKEIE